MTLEKALCTSEGLGSLHLPSPQPQPSSQTTPTKSATPPQPLSNATSLSSPPTQSSPTTPNPPRREVAQRRPSLSHQRSRSLGSHDLAEHILEVTTSAAGGDHDRAGLNLPSPHSLVALPTTGSCGEGGATAAGTSTLETVEAATSASSTCDTEPVSVREVVEHFPQFEADQPIANDLPMAAAPIISPPLLPAGDEDNKHLLTPSSSSSPPSKPRQQQAGRQSSGRRSSSQKSKGPAGFASADDLMHRLFVAVSGVADQLQTNHARDLRVILKHVFAVCQSEEEEEEDGGEPVMVSGRAKMEARGEDGTRGFMVQSTPTLLSNADGKSSIYHTCTVLAVMRAWESHYLP